MTEEEVKEKAETKEKLKKEKEKEAEQHDLRNLMAMCQRHRDERGELSSAGRVRAGGDSLRDPGRRRSGEDVSDAG